MHQDWFTNAPTRLTGNTQKNWNIKVGLSLQGVNVRNISFKPEAYPAGLPSGDYKYIQTGYYGNEIVGSVNIIVNIISPDKESFGWVTYYDLKIYFWGCEKEQFEIKYFDPGIRYLKPTGMSEDNF